MCLIYLDCKLRKKNVQVDSQGNTIVILNQEKEITQRKIINENFPASVHMGVPRMGFVSNRISSKPLAADRQSLEASCFCPEQFCPFTAVCPDVKKSRRHHSRDVLIQSFRCDMKYWHTQNTATKSVVFPECKDSSTLGNLSV